MRKKYMLFKLIFGVTGFSSNQSSHISVISLTTRLFWQKILSIHRCVRVLIRFDEICSPFLDYFIFREHLVCALCLTIRLLLSSAISVLWIIILSQHYQQHVITCYQKKSQLNLKRC